MWDVGATLVATMQLYQGKALPSRRVVHHASWREPVVTCLPFPPAGLGLRTQSAATLWQGESRSWRSASAEPAAASPFLPCPRAFSSYAPWPMRGLLVPTGPPVARACGCPCPTPSHGQDKPTGKGTLSPAGQSLRLRSRAGSGASHLKSREGLANIHFAAREKAGPAPQA